MDNFCKGDYVRWIIGHATYAAHPDKLVGADPIYKYGIVVQVSKKDNAAIIVHTWGADSDRRLVILNGAEEVIEILSKGGTENG